MVRTTRSVKNQTPPPSTSDATNRKTNPMYDILAKRRRLSLSPAMNFWMAALAPRTKSDCPVV